ncbi:hypothetical protein ASG67_03590 [Sphingomonas sp. Leaf339]|nr:hypothetical protein ASG67_03590 [Sphingomonas sp. Leaf339]
MQALHDRVARGHGIIGNGPTLNGSNPHGSSMSPIAPGSAPCFIAHEKAGRDFVATGFFVFDEDWGC